MCRSDTAQRVFKYDALLGQHTETLHGEQINIGCRLARVGSVIVDDLLSGEPALKMEMFHIEIQIDQRRTGGNGHRNFFCLQVVEEILQTVNQMEMLGIKQALPTVFRFFFENQLFDALEGNIAEIAAENINVGLSDDMVVKLVTAQLASKPRGHKVVPCAVVHDGVKEHRPVEVKNNRFFHACLINFSSHLVSSAILSGMAMCCGQWGAHSPQATQLPASVAGSAPLSAFA